MRPITQGVRPNIDVRTHRDYYSHIKNAIGTYCSYCERPLPNSELHVEHIRPQSTNEEYKLCWNNLLLSCFTCNSHKDNCDDNVRNITDLNFDEYAFPHIYDTYHLIDYPRPTYMPEFSQDADARYKPKVEKLMQLLRLSNDDNLSEVELLEENNIPSYRITIGEDADKTRKELGFNYSEEQIEAAKSKIMQAIKLNGFWSIWMKAFEDVDEIRAYLLDLIPGTEKRYFATKEEHDKCEHDHKYRDVLEVVEHRLGYKIENFNIHDETEWNNQIVQSIRERIPDLTDDEWSKIQQNLEELKM